VRNMAAEFCLQDISFMLVRFFLHAVNLRHGTDGFTSPPKEVVLRILSPLKIRRPRPGFNPRNLRPVASTILLDHRGRQGPLTQFSIPGEVEVQKKGKSRLG
jgi:hypothetical protein